VGERRRGSAARGARRAGPGLRLAGGCPGGLLVDAACRFVELTGGIAAIGTLEDAVAILRGDAGTIVTPSGEYDGVAIAPPSRRRLLRAAAS
jgi:carbamate kinase